MAQIKQQWVKRVKGLAWTSYIWLIYWPYTMLAYLPARQWQDWGWLLLGVFFLGLYILVTSKPRWRRFALPAELGVTALFAWFAGNAWLLIFVAWQVPFLLARSPQSQKRFWAFLGGYGLILGLSLLTRPVTLTATTTVGWVFPILSPFLSYYFARQVFQIRAMRQTNRRLEAIIQRDERERIARDLHDTLGQSFSLIAIKTELAKKLLVKAPEQVTAELDDIARTSRQDLQLVREIVKGLHEPSLSELLLAQSKALAAANVLLETVGETAAAQWPTAVQGILAAVLREALTNVMRHAHASQVTLRFMETPADYQVFVQDDGNGQRYQRFGSNGLQNMQSRLAAVNGTFNIGTNHIGTLLTLTLPKGEQK
ncbi:sensor histidine kinase [Loigolactobacillus bifermentans]|uniref:sensor histidine kinase n=1 Tax=Loigolactobacillus bifermentans TaxID=1607 RepID=UPI00070AFB13|nr:sensor histidine kinase [Loigolactobacillus bifermentans]QGG61190.1 sensor histidine kinase [Loigolactobacillus bifermentans]